MTMLTKMNEQWNALGNNIDTTIAASFSCTGTEPQDGCAVWQLN